MVYVGPPRSISTRDTENRGSVSYTHLDVYKRQAEPGADVRADAIAVYRGAASLRSASMRARAMLLPLSLIHI